MNITWYFQRKSDKSEKERFIKWNIELIKSRFAMTASSHQLPCLCSCIVKGMLKIVLDIRLRTLSIEVFRFTGLQKAGNLSCLICKGSRFYVYQRPNPNNFVCSLIYYLKCRWRSLFFLLGGEVMNCKNGSHFYFQTSTTYRANRKCIICQLDSGNHDLNYLTKNGIETFKNALRIRKDEVHDRTLMCFWRRNHCVTETVGADTLIRKN